MGDFFNYHCPFNEKSSNMRALLFFILVILVFVFIRFIFKRLDLFNSQQAEETSKETDEAEEQKMVVCEYCGVHLPENEAIAVAVNHIKNQDNKKYFCCKAHLESYIEERG